MIRNIGTKKIEKIIEFRNTCERVEKLHGVVNHKIFDKSDFNWILDEFEITGRIFGGNYFSTPNPFLVHVDTGKEEDLRGKSSLYNIVVPLSQQDDFNTVIFNQKFYGEATHFYIGSMYNYFPKPLYNHVERSYNNVQGLETSSMDIKTYKKYLSHLPYETVEHLSIKEIVPWKIGQAFVFESQFLHSSCNFNGIKEGLTLLVSDV